MIAVLSYTSSNGTKAWDTLANNGWLTDNVIDEGQSLLKRQYPHLNGLQRVVLGLTLSFAVQTEGFIQIPHTGYDHWVTVSTIGCREGEINAYNSLPPTPTAHLKNQIAALLATPRSSIRMNYIDTQMQCGSVDCGIFAIAFALTLANGEKPGVYHFDQPKMRKHLIQCLELKSISASPITRKR